MSDFEIHDERFRKMVLSNAPLETLGEGYRWLEGPESGRQFDADPRQYIRRFNVDGNSRLTGGAQFHKVLPGFADGFRTDEQGNIWSSAADGVHCISPDGEL